MKVTIGNFTREGIDSELGSDLTETVQAALCHYTGKLRAGRPPVGVPRFLASAGRSVGDATTLELTLDPEVEALLRHEASRQGVDVNALVGHSVLVYLAELDFISAPSRFV